MRWTKTIPQPNDVRVVRRFAWSPTRVNRSKDGRSETYVWLSFYYDVQRYEYSYPSGWRTRFLSPVNVYSHGDLPRGETLG